LPQFPGIGDIVDADGGNHCAFSFAVPSLGPEKAFEYQVPDDQVTAVVVVGQAGLLIVMPAVELGVGENEVKWPQVLLGITVLPVAVKN
jgi:hypothetical protein